MTGPFSDYKATEIPPDMQDSSKRTQILTFLKHSFFLRAIANSSKTEL